MPNWTVIFTMKMLLACVWFVAGLCSLLLSELKINFYAFQMAQDDGNKLNLTLDLNCHNWKCRKFIFHLELEHTAFLACMCALIYLFCWNFSIVSDADKNYIEHYYVAFKRAAKERWGEGVEGARCYNNFSGRRCEIWWCSMLTLLFVCELYYSVCSFRRFNVSIFRHSLLSIAILMS